MKDTEKMLVENEKLVFFTISQYFPDYISDDDIQQIGRIALWKSCERYDPAKGVFSSYCIRSIKREIWKHLMYYKRCGRDTPVVSLDAPLDDIDDKDLYRIVPCALDVDFIDIDEISTRFKQKHRKLIKEFVSGKNCKEAAESLGVSINTITTWSKEIKQIIKEYA